MKLVAVCGAMLVMLLGPVVAQPDHDLKIDQAAKDILARKIGDLRTGYDTGYAFKPATPQPVAVLAPTASIAEKAPVVKPQRQPSLPAKLWRPLSPTEIESTTVGSIQSFDDGAGGEFAHPPRSGRLRHNNAPRILRF